MTNSYKLGIYSQQDLRWKLNDFYQIIKKFSCIQFIKNEIRMLVNDIL